MAYLPGERPLVYPWQKVISNQKDVPCSRGIRNINIKLDVAGLGSAYIEWGTGKSATKMIAVVRGPRQQSANRSAFDVDVSFAQISLLEDETPDLGKDLASYIKEGIEGALSLELYPQSAVTIFIKVLQSGSSIHSLLSPAVIVAGVACKQAGIHMKDQVLSIPIAITQSRDYLIDPEDSVINSLPCITVGMTMSTRQVTVLHLSGLVDGGADILDSLINTADSALSQLAQVVADRTH